MKILLIVLISVVAAHAATKEVAKAGSKQYFTDASLTTDSDELTWEDASAFCKENKMVLATIYSKAELDAIVNWHKTFGPRIHIGATDIKTKGKWVWESTGKPLTFTNWAEGEPDIEKYSRCGSMTSGDDGLWHASYCDAAFAHALCEKP